MDIMTTSIDHFRVFIDTGPGGHTNAEDFIDATINSQRRRGGADGSGIGQSSRPGRATRPWKTYYQKETARKIR